LSQNPKLSVNEIVFEALQFRMNPPSRIHNSRMISKALETKHRSSSQPSLVVSLIGSLNEICELILFIFKTTDSEYQTAPM